jgi:hypothetical protein
MAYGIFRKVTTLELIQHHFAKSGHGDYLLMTRNLSQPSGKHRSTTSRAASAARAASLYAGHVQQLGGANPLPNLMEVKG